MALKGQKLVHPQSGEYFEFHRTAAETGGESTTLKVLIKPGGFKPAMHRHLCQDEVFEVISGRLTCEMGRGARFEVGPGERVVLPKALAHTHYNAGPEDLVAYQTASPALDFEPFVEALHYQTARGRVNKGHPPFLQLMVWMQELQGKTCVAYLPLGLQQALARVLAPLGRWMGYRAFYP